MNQVLVKTGVKYTIKRFSVQRHLLTMEKPEGTTKGNVVGIRE